MRQQSRQPDGNKMATFTEYLLKKREIPLVRKSYSLLLQVKLQEGVDEVGEDDDE
jgi:hypothetical protein